MKQILNTDQAPQAIGAYSQGIKCGGFLFLSGQIAIDKQSFEIMSDDVAIQTEIVLKNISALLKAVGGSLSNVVKTTIFLTNMDDFAEINKVYGEFFNDNPPARSCVAVAGLPKNALVEIEVTAYLERI